MFCLVKSTLASQNITSDKSLLADEHPTKEEWLEVYITHKIKQFSDLYAARIAIRVAIFPKNQEIVITLTLANQQEAISQTAKKIYCDEVEEVVKAILVTYQWAKSYKLTVQFI
jgi:hypothetical protein